MDVKIDSKLIRLEREKRAWTQEHLAKASGLSLRTIQRVESTGSASFESVRSLAAVLGLSVAELRDCAPAAEPGDAPRRPALSLPFRLLLAVVSGAACGIAFDSPLGPLDFLEPLYAGYGLGGLLFAATVLWPHLMRLGWSRDTAWRGFALTAASALSYYLAISTVLVVPPSWLGAERMNSPQALLLASALGAAVVLAAARMLLPLRVTAAYWPLGTLASVLGGVAVYTQAGLDGHYLGAAAGFACWHAAMCLAIHLGGETSVAGRRIARFIERTTSRTATSGLLQVGHAARA